MFSTRDLAKIVILHIKTCIVYILYISTANIAYIKLKRYSFQLNCFLHMREVISPAHPLNNIPFRYNKIPQDMKLNIQKSIAQA